MKSKRRKCYTIILEWVISDAFDVTDEFCVRHEAWPVLPWKEAGLIADSTG